jgi:serine/threonine protein phosphatase PrpC
MLLHFGSVLNHGSELNSGFDALSVNKGARIFVLADGANSSPAGGLASQLAVDSVIQEIQSNPHITSVEAFEIAHRKIREKVSVATGTTCLSAHIRDTIRIGACGDSLAEVYVHNFISGWRLSWRSTPDVFGTDNSPSQLLGSDVYNGPAENIIDIKRRTLVLLMSDGAYKFTSPDERRRLIIKLARDTPSESDLDYLARCLAELAHANSSRDDKSAIFIWIDPHTNAENIY